jgi:hypothetical protein
MQAQSFSLRRMQAQPDNVRMRLTQQFSVREVLFNIPWPLNIYHA